MSTVADRRKLFPSLRARMGDWWYYITMMSYYDVKEWIKKVDDIHEKHELKTWIQREIRPERLEQIAEYLIGQKQHFFNAIVAGIYRGEPDWYPLSVSGNPSIPTVRLQDSTKHTFGFLSLTGEEDIFPIDGQHRVEGIKTALARKRALHVDQQCVIFVAHEESDKGRARTRRLFSTLNKYAKPVSQGELVALSEDDTFAIVVRKLIDDYRYLNMSLVPLTKTANVPSNETRCITTVLGLYDLVRTISVPLRSREKKSLEIGPPKKARIQEIYDLVSQFWDTLRANFPEIKEVMDSGADDAAAKYRNNDGGHLLFRPAGMKAFATATRILMDRGVTLRTAVRTLSETTFDLGTPPWPGVLWNTVGNRMITRNGRLSHNLFLYMARQNLDATSYQILAEYRKALDDEKATLRSVVRL